MAGNGSERSIGWDRRIKVAVLLAIIGMMRSALVVATPGGDFYTSKVAGIGAPSDSYWVVGRGGAPALLEVSQDWWPGPLTPVEIGRFIADSFFLILIAAGVIMIVVKSQSGMGLLFAAGYGTLMYLVSGYVVDAIVR